MDNFNYSDSAIKQVADELGLYVYMLVDPRDGIPFYIGKGRGARFAAHGFAAMLEAEKYDTESTSADAREISAKNQRLQALNFHPEIWIVRHGMTSESQYTAVEAACIDAFRSFPITPRPHGETRLPHGCESQLTNLRREAARGHGLVRLDDLLTEKAAPLLEYPNELLLLTLGSWVELREKVPGGKTRYGYGYKSEWLASEVRAKHFEEIGLSTCCWWENDIKKVERVKYAVAVHKGVTRGLYRIIPGTFERSKEDPDRIGWQFEVVDSGEDFDAIVGPYGHRIGRKLAQKERYWPLKSKTPKSPKG